MSHGSSRWVALAALGFGLVVAACGGASSAPTTAASAPPPNVPAASAPSSTVGAISTGPASASCPTATDVGTALGITVPAPVSVGTGTGQLPTGAKGIACEYHAATLNVIIEIITNTDPSTISKFTANFKPKAVAVSGVGDQAFSFLQSLGGGKDNEGVVATKGSTLVSIGATATPATLTQVEALVSQLL